MTTQTANQNYLCYCKEMMEYKRFKHLVAKALGDLLDEFLEQLENIKVIVEDVTSPSPDLFQVYLSVSENSAEWELYTS